MKYIPILLISIMFSWAKAADNKSFPENAVRIKDELDTAINRLREKAVKDLEKALRDEASKVNLSGMEIIKEMISRIPTNTLIEPYAINANNYTEKVIDTTWIWDGRPVRFMKNGNLANEWGNNGRDVKWIVENGKISVSAQGGMKHRFSYCDHKTMNGDRDDGYKFTITLLIENK